MADHQSIKQLRQSACQDGRVIHLANLNLVSKKTDVERLVAHIQEMVQQKFGVALTPEFRTAGEPL